MCLYLFPEEAKVEQVKGPTAADEVARIQRNTTRRPTDGMGR